MNEQLDNVYNLFNRFKLGNSLHRFDCIGDFKNIDIPNKEEELVEELKYKTAVELGLSTLKNNPSAFNITKNYDGTFSCKTELLVLKLEDFKSIVEAAIEMMPEVAINKIRNGK